MLPSQRGVCLNCDVFFSAEINCRTLPKQWMNLELIDCGSYRRVFKEMFQMMLQEITDTYILNFVFFLQFYKSSPSLQSQFLVFWILSVVLLRSWPMNQNQIQILTIQFVNNFFNSFSRLLITLLIGKNFACDIKFLSTYSKLLYNFPQLNLICIKACSVQMCVSQLYCGFCGLYTLGTCNLICPIPNHRYFIACRQGNSSISTKFRSNLHFT